MLNRLNRLLVLALAFIPLLGAPVAGARIPDAQLDSSDWERPAPFVIQETRREVSQPPPMQPSKPQFGIVGLDLSIRNRQYASVAQVFHNTPAAHAGIRSGDVIVSVDGQSTMGKSPVVLDRMISDVPGNTMQLVIARGNELKQVSLTVMALTDAASSIRATYAGWLPAMQGY